MEQLQRRVQNLESSNPRNKSGFIPHTPEWMDWWLTYVPGLWAKGETLPHGEKMPFEVGRVLVQTTPDGFFKEPEDAKTIAADNEKRSIGNFPQADFCLAPGTDCTP